MIPLMFPVEVLLFSQVTTDELFDRLVFGKNGKDVQPGHTYIVREKRPKKTFSWFWKKIENGYEGLLVTRQHPDHVEKKFETSKLKILWLSTTLGETYVDPHNLGSLTNIISRFADRDEKTVIMLDGIEYLLVNNDFPRVLKFIEYLNEVVMEKRSILLIPIDPRALRDREQALLERNAEVR